MRENQAPEEEVGLLLVTTLAGIWRHVIWWVGAQLTPQCSAYKGPPEAFCGACRG